MSKRINRDDVDKWMDYGINIPTRTIYMGSVGTDSDDGETGTDFQMAERIVKALHILDSASQEPIHIILNNCGGDDYHGLAIYDAIKACRSHVDITVFGHAMSMGSIIMQAADKRIMSQNAVMMVHYGTFYFDGHALDAERATDENKRINKWMEQLYLEKMKEVLPNTTLEQVQDMCKFDTYITSDVAVRLGLADEVL